MKKFYLLLLSLSMGLSSVFADGVVRTYTNVTAGSLSTRISNDNVDPLTITDLTITGNLNGTDLRLIREMAGNNYLGEPKSGSLKKLDLSGANIVAGGEKYLDTDRITSSTGTYTQNNGYNSFHYETENNVLGKSLFAGCDKLEEVILPNSLTAIGEYQFWYCLNLKSISIGKNVSSIGWQLVFGPNKLTNISIAEGNATFSSPANTNLLMQGTKVFFGYGNPTFPAGTTVIGSDAFSSCTGLGDVTLPEGVTTIEGGAFAWSSLKSISFPSTLTTIGNDAFAGCYNLTSFTLPKTVTHYGEGLGALKDCGNLTSISVDKDNPVYDSRDNCNAIIETSTNTLISGCKNTVIPTSVTILGHQAFRGVTLSNYVIPNWITTIGEMAFWNANMTSVTIPNSVTYIGEFAFAYPTSLTTVTVESVTPVAISENTFTDRSNIDLIVPEGCSAAYKGANYWKDFKSIKDTKGNSEDPITEATINVATAGTLATKISNDEKFTITDLTITGQLNGTDFRLLREMAGCDYQGRPTNGQLQKFDLSGATIVAGGDKYYDSDGLYDKNGNMQYGFGQYSVTTKDNVIGDCLFAGCSKLEEIKIPANAIEIGVHAFMCTNISSFDILEAVEKVDLSFFYGTKMSTLHIPQNVTTLTASDCFMGNQSTLASITVDANNAKYDSRNNCNAIIEKESTSLILGCKNTTIPDGVTSIGKYAFERFFSLTSITIPTSVTSLQEGAFFAAGLTSISLPSTLKRIEFNALAYNNIASITIPASVEFIGQSAMRACSNLTQITVDADNTIYDSRDNCNAIIETATNTLIQGCKTSTIPATVTAIGSQAFQECHNLASITIPPSVTSIADFAFYDCENLISVSVGAKLPLAISEYTFSNRNNADLIVPEGCSAAYKGANYWKDFKSIKDTKGNSEDPITEATINVATAGTLSTLISETNKNTIRTLTLTGSLNGEDFRFIREMAGSDYNGVPTDGNLTTLDLSGATIVEGGSYIEIQDKKVYLNKEKTSYTSSGGAVDGVKVSEANKIGAYLFAGCQKLQTITLPNNITAINEFGFWSTGLTAITMPNTVTSIGFDAFFGCWNLVSVAISSSVMSINYPFLGCTNLASITVDSRNSVYDSRNNCNAIIETSSNTLIIGCKNTSIPSSVTTIGSDALAWHKLTSIIIPSSVTTIENRAFSGCALTSLTIPSGVTNIGDQAFANNELQTVTVENPTPVAIYDETFSNRSNIDLIVPEGRSAAYKVAKYWKDFKSIKDTKGNSEDPITGATINVATAGTLATKISNDEKFSITDLTITGPLNGTDFRLLREMAGCDYLGRPTNGQLQKLDLSGATIVAGGDKYFDRDGLYDEDGNMQYGFNSHSVTTRDNVIGECLFAGCSKLEEIKIPTNTIEIGEFAFMRTDISSFDIPEAVVKVALPFFYGTKVSTLHIPKNVTTLTASYFMGNQATLSSITVDANNAKFDSRNNCNAIIEKESNTLLLGCKNTTIPDGVTSIGEYAFSYSYGYSSITLPTSVTSLQEGAFFASGLASISLPSALKRIEFNALAYTNIASITIPASVEFIGQSALRACTDLSQITVEADNTKYDSRNNCNAIIETATNTLIQGCNTATIPATVTALGNQAFQECHNLANITIPSSVTSIADCAFYECENLTSVSVGVNTPLAISENTFSNRAEATLYVPEGSKTAYEGANYWKEFSSIEEVAEMVDPSVRTVNVTTAGTLSQLIRSDDKYSITELTITGQLNGNDFALLRAMAGNDMNGKPTTGKLSKLDISGATIIAGGTYLDLDGSYIDLGNNNILYVYPEGAKSSVANTFGEYLFAGCQQLQSVKTPTSLVKIENHVFERSGLTSIDLNSGLTTLDPYAFWYSKLSSITIPNTVIHIGDKNSVDNPFAYINELTSIILEAGNTRYAIVAEGKLLIDTQRNAVVSALGNAAIPEGITWIGQNAFCNRPELVNYTIPNWVTQIGGNSFSQCYNLESVVISNQMTTITNSAFTDCTKLTSVTIPSSVTKIMYNAFGDTGLTEITIPSSVTSIEGQAFAHNQNLTTVISYITNPFDMSDDVFAKDWDSSNTNYPQTLKVPSGTKDLYKAKTGWNKIANIVEMGQASAITVTAKSCSRAYGEANPTFESEVTGGTVTGTPEITCAATATSNVGTYPIVIAAGTIAETNVQYVNGTLAVTKAPLKISAGNYTKKQGEENPTFTLTYDGFKNNETAAVFTTQPTITCAATKDSPAGTYDITVSGAVAGNYEISYVAGTLTVEAVTPPTPMPEPKGTTFDLDTDDSSSKEVKVTFVVKESESSSTPTVAISDDKDASGSVSIPESVTHNGVEYKVTEISEGAFQNNTSLTEVKIPASITSIGANAFAGCKNLQSITINIIVPINLSIISARGYTRAESGGVFDGVDKNTCILYVPEGSVDAYKAAPVWKDFKIILPIKTSTRIYGIESDGEVFDVYSLSGQKVKSKTTSLDGLPRGIYIINGKKVIK